MWTHVCERGDVLDAICKKVYGTEQVVVRVYQANPGLADYGPYLPEGLEIILPEIIIHNQPKFIPTINLWD